MHVLLQRKSFEGTLARSNADHGIDGRNVVPFHISGTRQEKGQISVVVYRIHARLLAKLCKNECKIVPASIRWLVSNRPGAITGLHGEFKLSLGVGSEALTLVQKSINGINVGHESVSIILHPKRF